MFDNRQPCRLFVTHLHIDRDVKDLPSYCLQEKKVPRGTIRLNFDHPIVNFGENLESSASFQVVTAVHSTESINRFDILLKDYLTYSAFDKEDQWVVEKSEEELKSYIKKTKMDLD